mgnify:CR=1 FL=1
MRNTEYRKNLTVEEALKLMNENLAEAESSLINAYEAPEKPTVFIVGAQRSGTTLLMQLLLNHFEFAFINNFISRYWKSPYLGSLIFKSLNLSQAGSEASFNSDLGYTKGLLGPHEFGYFWKEVLPTAIYEDNDYDSQALEKLKNTIAAIQSIDGKPFLVKNLISCSFHVKKLAELLPTSYFVYIERDPQMVIQSTYQSRLKLFESESEWFGLKPAEYLEIKDLPVFEQIAAQVKYTKDHIEKDLQSIPEDRYMSLKYEDLTSDPAGVMNLLKLNFSKIGVIASETDSTLPQFNTSNKFCLEPEKMILLKKAYQKYFEEN